MRIIGIFGFVLVMTFQLTNCPGGQSTKTNKDTNTTLVNSASTQAINYDAYGKILSAHVNSEGKVNYTGIKADPKGLMAFTDFLATYSEEDYKALSGSEKLCLLINAYNALTLKLIVDNDVPKSIRDIAGGDPWNNIKFKLMGKEITLNHLENGVIRVDFSEPFIHMALVCAAKSCPILLNEPYTPVKLQSQFESQTKKYLASPEGLKIDKKAGKVFLSSIFDWYGQDWISKYKSDENFKNKDDKVNAVLNFVANFAKEEDKAYLMSNNFEIAYSDYSWELNSQ